METFFVNSFAEEIFNTKYRGGAPNAETFYNNLATAVALGDQESANKFFNLMWSRKFTPGGRILAFGGRPDARLSLMNCTTHSVEDDSLEAINTASFRIMTASSRGQGIGIDISAMRPKDSPVNNAARTSTGAVSFMEMFNAVGSTIGQEGRRAAMLFSIRDDHPDLWRPEDKYDFLHIKKIPGKVESANISIKISDKFMEAVQNDDDWTLRFDGTTGGTDFSFVRKVKAKELFYEIAKSAHSAAEPGLLFWDTSRMMSNSDLFGERWAIAGVNACSEETLDQDGVCNLGSMNLSMYVHSPFTSDASFDMETFAEDVKTAIQFLDNVVTLEIERGNYISKAQLESLEYIRRLGLGVIGLADMLAMLNLTYGSKMSLLVVERVMETMRNAAYEETIDLAISRGRAKVWDTVDNWDEIVKGGFYSTLPDYLKDAIKKYGTRNVTVMSIAPTGTISNLLGVSGGIEPVFARNYVRRTRIHGFDTFINYVHPAVEQSRAAGVSDSIWATAYDVSGRDHILMQATVQAYVDTSIAKTINLPAKTTVDDVFNLYMLGWLHGLKGMTVYRDGSRTEQILYTEDEQDQNEKTNRCPVCDDVLVVESGCSHCLSCSYSMCSL